MNDDIELFHPRFGGFAALQLTKVCKEPRVKVTEDKAAVQYSSTTDGSCEKRPGADNINAKMFPGHDISDL